MLPGAVRMRRIAATRIFWVLLLFLFTATQTITLDLRPLFASLSYFLSHFSHFRLLTSDFRPLFNTA